MSYVVEGAKKRRRDVQDEPCSLDNTFALKRSKGNLETGVVVADNADSPTRPPMNDLPLPPSHSRPARQLFIFGNGDCCQLGLGTGALEEISTPRLHAWFEAAAQSDTLGGEVGAGIESVCAGGMHTLVIDELGRVWSWGVNDNAALGRATTGVADPDNSDEVMESEILEAQPLVIQKLVDQDFRAVKVVAGDGVSVAINPNGHLRVWGSFRASDGLLGFNHKDGEPRMQLDPVLISSLANELFVQVACGENHVLALTVHGTVYAWGNGQQAQLGRRIIERRKANGLSPERLALRRIVHVAAGAYHSFAISETGVVYAWGLNNMRQTGVKLATDEEEEDIVWTPTEIEALDPKMLGHGRKVVEISGGEHHTIFLLSDGSVYGCGRCDGNQLGLADSHPAMQALKGEAGSDGGKSTSTSSSSSLTSYISKPTFIQFPPLPTPSNPNPSLELLCTNEEFPPSNPIAHISAGLRHNLAVSRAGHAYSWGLGLSGQLGLGSNVEVQKTPSRLRSRILDELRGDGKGWSWVVEDASAGGQHCVLVARKIAA